MLPPLVSAEDNEFPLPNNIHNIYSRESERRLNDL
jgi:hypothetical protein